MYIEVKYYGKTYGTGSSARKYKLTISKTDWRNDISIKFDFESPTDGQSANTDANASVIGGEINLPKRQALALASAILWYLQQAEDRSEPSAIELMLNEEDIISKITPKVTVRDLARILEVEEEYIIQEARNYSWPNTFSPETYISLDLVNKIYESLTKDKSGNCP